jgi:hypothetical protein
MKYITTQTSFKSGRLSEKLQGRIDVSEYQNGLSIGENALIDKAGGAYKKYGIKKIQDIPLNLSTYRSETFLIFDNKEINLVFSEDGWFLLDEEGNYITTFINAWTGLDPALFDFALYNNEIYIVHYSGTLQPYRIGLALNSLGKVEIVNATTGPINMGYYWSRPMSDFNTNPAVSMRVTTVNTPPNHQVEASVPYFSVDMVGEFLMLKDVVYYESVAQEVTGMYQITGYVSDTLVNVVGVLSYSIPAVDNSGDTRNWSSTTSNFDVMANFGEDASLDSTTSGYTDVWAQSAWSSRLGWPRTVTVDEGRLMYGGTPSRPATFYGSRVNQPLFFLDKRFTTKTSDGYFGDIVETDPFQFTLASSTDSAITFMLPASALIIGTTGREYIISGGGQLVSKKNISARPHTAHGSEPILTAVYDTNVFYTGREGKQLFLLRYTEENGSYISKEISVLFDDLLEDTYITKLSWNEGLSCLFVILADGNMITVTINNETGTLACSTHNFEDSNILILDTSFSPNPNGTRQNFIYEISNRKYFGTMEKSVNTAIPTEALDANLHKRVPHADVLNESTYLVTRRKINYIDHVNDFIFCNETSFYLGEPVQIQSSGTPISDLNISLNTTYYAIPYKPFGTNDIGIRLALSEADALSNTYIDITHTSGPLGPFLYNDQVDMFLESQSDLQKISIKEYADGTVINGFSIETNGSPVAAIQHIKQSGDETIDLGTPNIYVAYGVAFEFHIATMPIEAGQQWGSSQLGLKRPDKVSVRYYKTYGFSISTDGYNEEEVIVDEYSTGRKEIAITANSEYDSIIHIRNTNIEPCYIINMTIRGLSNDG